MALMDLIFEVEQLPQQAMKYPARSYRETGGGIAANGAVTVSRLGGQAVLWSRIGDDDSGQRIRNELETFEVDCQHLQVVPNCHSALSCVLVDQAGERLLVNHCDNRLFANTAGLVLPNTRHTAAFLADLRWPGATEFALRFARDNHLPAVLGYDQINTNNLSHTEILLRLASHVVFGREALQQFSGNTQAEAGLGYARDYCDGIIAVTLGEQGVLWLDHNNQTHHLAAFSVDVVDTLAAGDVFHGALALSLAEGQSLESGMRFASAAAALKCTRFGGRLGIPERAEVEIFLQYYTDHSNSAQG